jgi:hypothetical protein
MNGIDPKRKINMFFAPALRTALLGAALSCAFAAPAHALSSITYVSNTGVDTGACATAATACRTIAYAISKTFGEAR